MNKEEALEAAKNFLGDRAVVWDRVEDGINRAHEMGRGKDGYIDTVTKTIDKVGRYNINNGRAFGNGRTWEEALNAAVESHRSDRA